MQAEKRQMFASHQKLHSILEHGELALRRPSRYSSMVFVSPNRPTYNLPYTMENDGATTPVDNKTSRKNSTSSVTSEGSAATLALRQATSDNFEQSLKLSLPPSPAVAHDDLGSEEANTIQRLTNHTSSSDCLSDFFHYSATAKITDHFPTKTLTASPKVFNATSERRGSHQHIHSARAPVATIEDPTSPELELDFVDTTNTDVSFEPTSPRNISTSEGETSREDSCHSLDSNTQRAEHTSAERSTNKIRFLPAYREKTVKEMMQDRSPRAVKLPANNKSVYRSPSAKSSSSIMQNYNNTMYPQPGRIYSTPPPQIRAYNNMNRNHRSTIANARVNDGTHPRMPMRAVEPQTYNGMPYSQPRHSSPVNYNSSYGTVRHNTNYGTVRHDPNYGTVRHDPNYGAARQESSSYGTFRRVMPYAQHPSQPMSYRRKATSHSDMRSNSGKMSSDSSSQSQVDGRNIRGANSESEVDRPYTSSSRFSSNTSIPSGPYLASSSMTSLPQYAQLITPSPPTPQRSDSAGNVRRPSGLPLENNLNTRHSYTANSRPQKLSVPTQRVNSCDDVFNDSTVYTRKRGSTTPTSPVSRQPSYLTAMNKPIRPKISRNEENAYSTSAVVLRNNASPPTEEAHQKIQRRTSYIMATLRASPTEELQKTPNQKYRKLKKFFGENTPSIKEGQEKALQPSSQRELFTLPDNLEVQKTGILAVKILAIEGKKSHTRSWRGMGAVLSREMLYLLKDKKENANMLTAPSGSLSIDEKPICIVACYVAIEYAYTKKRHVFKLITSTTSEYLLQAEDERDMIEWIRAIEANRHPDKESERLTSAELVRRINNHHTKKKRSLGGLSFKSKQQNTSPFRDGSQKGDVKMTKTSSETHKFPFDNSAEQPSGDFGMPIHDCSPSHENEFVPLVVELCTKAIEDRGLDFVGIYRVPGNKAAVEMLKKELNQGIINLENDKWKDVNVLSSLLKTYFRQLPDSLITANKYKSFIETNKITDARTRLVALKQLIKTLPDYNYETLKYLAIHLRKVAEHGEQNKMDTRNIAIVFGPTIVRAGDDMMTFVKDMSAQCCIIESIILYCDWMFSSADENPPAINEEDVSVSAAPISETMNNLSAVDLVAIAGDKSKSKAQLVSALSSAVGKKNKSPHGPVSISSPTTAVLPLNDEQQATGDDHGFKNRDLQQKAAARNQRLQHQKEKELREWHVPHYAAQGTNTPSVKERCSQQLAPHPIDNSTIPRWHSEESVLMEHTQKRTHDQYPYRSNNHSERHVRQLSYGEHESTPPPPIPARGVDSKPPLPPKPMQLYHAKPTCINSPEWEGLPRQLYENYEHLELEKPEHMPPQRTLRIIQSQLKTASLRRRGSLDSMMDTLEPFHAYSSSSSTESQDGSGLLSSLTATFDHKLKLLEEQSFGQSSSSRERTSTSTGPSRHGSSEQSRESLLSILSNKDHMNACESFSSTQDMQSSDRGFDGSTSSVGSVPYRPDAKVGIASRIERKDMKPMGYPPATNTTQTRVVNATGSVISHRDHAHGDPSSDDDDGDMANNNSVNYENKPLIHRHMSDEKKRVRRRHTVGGAPDIELFKDALSQYKAKQNLTLNEASVEPLEETLTAWQRLQPGGNREPLTLRDWLERERFRASSPELEMNNMPNIMHFQRVSQQLSGSLLESNT
ncbi:rho GTPase-activating protein 21-like isoform X2 [Watersipora subatra]|uniref:rho GTPase-activating protein 21-like isoform X2 n=1 Tax=Watersipora subatra TaxID=2589382 RepID=UPI00355C170E